jgi:hypothetical protein
MPLSDRAPRLRGGLLTLLGTLALAGLLALSNSLVSLVTYDAAGTERTLPIADIWQRFFARLPQGAPGILGTIPLLIALIVAFLALAYALVATFRLPE